ncbi:MAG: hypothetical protein RPU14_03880 [Candidatus Sedimenticola sp. (ex Thyasira tokunagai)]
MNGTQLSEIEIHRKARIVVSDLAEMPGFDAMMVINQAQSIILRENLAKTPLPAPPVHPFNPNLMRRRHVSMIDADAELKAFIHGLPAYTTIDEITTLCREQFGAVRAPSRSSIGRYLQNLSKRYPKEKESE